MHLAGSRHPHCHRKSPSLSTTPPTAILVHELLRLTAASLELNGGFAVATQKQVESAIAEAIDRVALDWGPRGVIPRHPRADFKLLLPCLHKRRVMLLSNLDAAMTQQQGYLIKGDTSQ